MALFKRSKAKKQAAKWGWDPQGANLTGEQAWALLTNAIYFRATAPRMDTLGGGLEGLDWAEGLALWWDVRNENEYEELVGWTQDQGYRRKWAKDGADEGDEKFAWDYCRLITVSGGAAIAQVIESERAWSVVMDAADELATRFGSWQEVADNYLSGRILWLKDKGQWEPTPDPSQAQFENVANELFVDESSPWNRMAWDRSSGVILDGAPFVPDAR